MFTPGKLPPEKIVSGFLGKDFFGGKIAQILEVFLVGLEVLGERETTTRRDALFFHVSRPLQHTFAWFNREQKKGRENRPNPRKERYIPEN